MKNCGVYEYGLYTRPALVLIENSDDPHLVASHIYYTYTTGELVDICAKFNLEFDKILRAVDHKTHPSIYMLMIDVEACRKGGV